MKHSVPIELCLPSWRALCILCFSGFPVGWVDRFDHITLACHEAILLTVVGGSHHLNPSSRLLKMPLQATAAGY